MNVLVKKGYLSHNGIMYKAGTVVDIDDLDIIKELKKQKNFEISDFVEEAAETLPPVVSAESEEIEDDTGEEVELPEVDASATVKKTITRGRKSTKK